ncbi:MAG: hypothetical protein U0Q15_07890 [Kineosporiaceae bacterium]
MSAEIQTSWGWRDRSAAERDGHDRHGFRSGRTSPVHPHPPHPHPDPQQALPPLSAEEAIDLGDGVDVTPLPTPTSGPRPRRTRRTIGLAAAVCCGGALVAGAATTTGLQGAVRDYAARVGAPVERARPEPAPAAGSPADTPSTPGTPPPPAGPTRPRGPVAGDAERAPHEEGAPHEEAGDVDGRTTAPDVAHLASALPDGTWLGATLTLADRAETDPERLAVDLTLLTAPTLTAEGLPAVDLSDGAGAPRPVVTADGRPMRVAAAQVLGLGTVLPDREDDPADARTDAGAEGWPANTGTGRAQGVQGRVLATNARAVLHARLLPDCTSWWAPAPRLRLTLVPAALTPDPPSAGAPRTQAAPFVTEVELPATTAAAVLPPRCPAPRHGLALAITSARAVGPGSVEARVVNHGSRPARLHVSPGWLDGRVRLDAPASQLAPGRATRLVISVTSVTSTGSDGPSRAQRGRTGPTLDICTTSLSAQLADAALVQGADPDEPDLGLVTASDVSSPGATFGRALSVAGIRCSPSGASQS